MPDISFACPSCNQGLEAPEDMEGQAVECPACRKTMTVPGLEDGSDPGAVESPVEAAKPEAIQACPGCKSDMAVDAVLCLNCGFHTKLGKKINTSFG